MNIHVDIGGSEALSLKGALLVYQGWLGTRQETPSRVLCFLVKRSC